MLDSGASPRMRQIGKSQIKISMKKIYILMGLLLVVSGVRAQEQGQDDTSRRLDSLQQVVNRLTTNVETLEKDNLNQAIWKDRAKYFNIGYVNQTVTDKTFGGEIKSDFGVSLSSGKTYYLHKKPIVGMIKFGLDWTWLDINYAKSAWDVEDADLGEIYSMDMHQAEIGMRVGPSVAINPVHHLKVGGYFHFAPSYSGLYMDDTFYHNYVSMWSAGCSIAWKVISVGVEWRWGTAKYDGLTFGEAFDEDSYGDEDVTMDDVMDKMSAGECKFKTKSVRFYIGFRF